MHKLVDQLTTHVVGRSGRWNDVHEKYLQGEASEKYLGDHAGGNIENDPALQDSYLRGRQEEAIIYLQERDRDGLQNNHSSKAYGEGDFAQPIITIDMFCEPTPGSSMSACTSSIG